MTETMLAGRLDVRTRAFAVTEVPRPTPGPGEVLVRVAAAGICLSDVHLIEGQLSPLFLAGDEGICVFAPNNQTKTSKYTVAIPATPSAEQESHLFSKLTSLAASSSDGRTVVWGLNSQKHVVHASCPAGRETFAKE